MRFLYLFVVALFLGFVTASCSRYRVKEQPQSTSFTLSFEVNSPLRATHKEQQVRHLMAVLFRQEASAWSLSLMKEYDTPLARYALDLKSGSYRMILIANAPDALKNQLKGLSSLTPEQFEQLVVKGAPSADDNEHFIRVSEPQDFDLNADLSLPSIALKRLAARFDLVNHTQQFLLKFITYKARRVESTLGENATPPAALQEADTPYSIDLNPGDSYLEKIYGYETSAPETRFFLEGSFMGQSIKKEVIIPEAIKRNRCYTLTVDSSPEQSGEEAISFSVAVADWQEAPEFVIPREKLWSDKAPESYSLQGANLLFTPNETDPERITLPNAQATTLMLEVLNRGASGAVVSVEGARYDVQEKASSLTSQGKFLQQFTLTIPQNKGGQLTTRITMSNAFAPEHQLSFLLIQPAASTVLPPLVQRPKLPIEYLAENNNPQEVQLISHSAITTYVVPEGWHIPTEREWLSLFLTENVWDTKPKFSTPVTESITIAGVTENYQARYHFKEPSKVQKKAGINTILYAIKCIGGDNSYRMAYRYIFSSKPHPKIEVTVVYLGAKMGNPTTKELERKGFWSENEPITRTLLLPKESAYYWLKNTEGTLLASLWLRSKGAAILPRFTGEEEAYLLLFSNH